MKPHQAYQQTRGLPMPRIDLVLSLYDGVIGHIERALALLPGNATEARLMLAKAQIAISAMAAGADPATDLGNHFLRLYEYALHCLASGSETKIQGALGTLRTLREGFQAVRDKALEMERAGEIPPLDAPAMHTLA